MSCRWRARGKEEKELAELADSLDRHPSGNIFGQGSGRKESEAVFFPPATQMSAHINSRLHKTILLFDEQ